LQHLAAELVAEHHLVLRRHEPLEVRLQHQTVPMVAVLARVKIGTANAAAQHVEQDLSLPRLGIGSVDEFENGIPARHRLHDPSAPKGESISGAALNASMRRDRPRAQGSALAIGAARPASSRQKKTRSNLIALI